MNKKSLKTLVDINDKVNEILTNWNLHNSRDKDDIQSAIYEALLTGAAYGKMDFTWAESGLIYLEDA